MTPSLSVRREVQLVPLKGHFEEVLLAGGEQVGHGNLYFALCINKAKVVFLKGEHHVIS